MEVKIKEFKPMTVLDILDNVLDEVIEGMNEVTHKSDETSDLLWVMANHEIRTISGGVSDNDETD